MSRMAMAVVVVVAFAAAGCGQSSSAIEAGSGASSSTPMVAASTTSPPPTTLPTAPDAPEGDADAIQACVNALAAEGVDPAKVVLMAGFSTTKAVLAAWRQTREPGQPGGVSTYNQPPPDMGMSVCYADGNVLRRGPPPSPPVSGTVTPPTVEQLPYTREIFEVRADGISDGDRVGPREYLPIRRPAADAEPLNLLAAPGFTIPPEMYAKYPELARDSGAPGYSGTSSSSSG